MKTTHFDLIFRVFSKAVPALVLSAAIGCAGQTQESKAHLAASPPAPDEQQPSNESLAKQKEKTDVDLRSIESAMVQKFGEAHRERIARGVKQVHALWQTSDGDLLAFAQQHFAPDEAAQRALFARLQATLEQVDGHMNEISRELRRPTDTEMGPMLPIDPLLAALDPSAHLTEDFFRSKIAFVALLNFPLHTFEQKSKEGSGWSRDDWARSRLTQRFSRRVPAEVQQEITARAADADLYIAEYNIWMHHVVDEQGRRPFPKGLRLISHWNLRDELKAAYGTPDALAKQRLIVAVMQRIVTQSIPAVVINNPRVDWNPVTNTVAPSPNDEVEEGASPIAAAGAAAPLDPKPEPDIRYEKILANFRAAAKADPYSPSAPTQIARSFELGRELSEERVRSLLLEVMTSPLVRQVADHIHAKLNRKLEPADLWYAGFKSRGDKNESTLDALTKKRYPDARTFQASIPDILQKLAFTPARAKYIADKIRVDASRGAGHAMPAMRRGDYPRLRTRIEKDGMNYKGYNIAIHELGHNVEQVFSLYDVDHTLLQGVPNNAFTEALAFVFQARDLELLGLQKPSEESERMRVLGDFWATFEIAGVAMVDIDMWHWMYDHPNATAAELRAATVQLAKDYWNKYYEPILGGHDTTLLGIYSHMVAYPLYVADYPIGHLIAFQIEEQLKKTKHLGAEFERVAKFGSLMPDLWMKHAAAAPVSAEPLLRATEVALKPKGAMRSK